MHEQHKQHIQQQKSVDLAGCARIGVMGGKWACTTDAAQGQSPGGVDTRASLWEVPRDIGCTG